MAYIDRDKLMKELSTMYKSPTSSEDFMTVGYDHAIADVVVTVHEQPTADVVEVVRCKDCKHRPTGTGANHDLEFPDDECPCQCAGDYWYSWMPSDDWFCPKGERKEVWDGQ